MLRVANQWFDSPHYTDEKHPQLLHDDKKMKRQNIKPILYESKYSDMFCCNILSHKIEEHSNLQCWFHTDYQDVIRASWVSPAGCLRADKHRLMETRSPHNSDMKVLSHCFSLTVIQRGQIIPDTFMEQRVQQANASQTEQGFCLYDKANMKPLFLGLWEHTRAGEGATTESGRLQRGDRNMWGHKEHLASRTLTWVS